MKFMNLEQKSQLVQFMSNNPKLRIGKYSASFTQKRGQQLWKDVTVQLNSIPNGVQRNWCHWKKTWQSIRAKALKRASESKRLTGNVREQSRQDPWDPIDEQVLHLIGAAAAAKCDESEESRACSNFNEAESNSSPPHTDIGAEDNAGSNDAAAAIAVPAGERVCPRNATQRLRLTHATSQKMLVLQERRNAIAERVAIAQELAAAAAVRSAEACEHSAAADNRAAVASERSAAAKERTAAANERKAVANERKAAAKERTAAAIERAAAANERKAISTERISDSCDRMAVALDRIATEPTTNTLRSSVGRYNEKFDLVNMIKDEN